MQSRGFFFIEAVSNVETSITINGNAVQIFDDNGTVGISFACGLLTPGDRIRGSGAIKIFNLY